MAPQMSNGHSDTTSPIAIIGLATRYADEATDTEKFWEFLLKGRQSTRHFPEDRFNSDAFYHPDPEHGGSFHAKGGHFLGESPNGFDASFFSMSTLELLSLDPQQRILMENVYHALENAGLPIEKILSSNTSVFVNGFNSDQAERMNSDLEISLKHKLTGSEPSMISGRVSWFYDFKGPSMTVDTACSGSMVALHLARLSLSAGESDMSVVSGVNVLSYLPHWLSMSYSGFLGAEGKSFAFDERADGYARGEGVGTVVLKPLKAALQNGDTIRAVLRGSGLNHDGRTPGMTYPSATAQEELIRSTYKAAGLDPRDTAYVESHGTGTQAGDYCECSAIASAFDSQSRDVPLHIGAVKPNIGHVEGGAGIAGVIKAILVAESGVIPPIANHEKVNPKLPSDWNLHFPTAPKPWPQEGPRRISISSYGLSGTNAHCIIEDAYHYLEAREIDGNHFTRITIPTDKDIPKTIPEVRKKRQLEDGFVNGDYLHTNGVSTKDHSQTNGLNGVNGVKQQTNGCTEASQPAHPQLFLFSGTDKDAVLRCLAGMKPYLSKLLSQTESERQESLRDLAYTLSSRRSRLSWASYVISASVQQLEDKLSQGHSPPKKTRSVPSLGFVFTGQGAQYAQMGRQLLVYPVFRESLEKATAYFKSLGSDWSLLDELTVDKPKTRISSPAITHPACSAIQIALVDLLTSWNIIPNCVIGHSSGEIAAAYCAGKLCREAAWKASYYRGYVLTLRSAYRRGGMVAVGMSESQLLPLLKQIRLEYPEGELTIACYNSPKNQTVSGDEALIDALKERLDAQGVFARRLPVQNAYHSSHMKDFASDYKGLIGKMPSGPPLQSHSPVQMFSTLTGQLLEDAFLDASYWAANMPAAVQFTKGFAAMSQNVDVIVEVGPHPAMQSAAKDIIGGQRSVVYQSTLTRHDPTVQNLLHTIGSLAINGVPVDIERVNQADKSTVSPRTPVNLPPYPFSHTEQGLYESRLMRNLRLRKFPRDDILGAPVTDWDPAAPRWRHFLRISENPWLRDHKIGEDYVFPGAGYMTMAITAAMQTAERKDALAGVHLKDVQFTSMLVVPETTLGVEVCFTLYPVESAGALSATSWKRFTVCSYDEEADEWVAHSSGYVLLEYSEGTNPIDAGREEQAELAKWTNLRRDAQQSCQNPVDLARIREKLANLDIKIGPSFHNIDRVAVAGHQDGVIFGDVIVPDIRSCMPKNYMHKHLIHPATLDGAFQAALAAIYDFSGENMLKRGCVPSSVKHLWISTTRVSAETGTRFPCWSKATPAMGDAYECNFHAWSESERAFALSGVRLAPFKALTGDAEDQRSWNCYSMEWRPDVDLLRSNDFDKIVESPRTRNRPYESQMNHLSKLQLAATLLITTALTNVRDVDVHSLVPSYQSFVGLLKHAAADIILDAVPYVSFNTWNRHNQNCELRRQLFSEVERIGPSGSLLIKMGSRLASFLRGEEDPTQLAVGKQGLTLESGSDSPLSSPTEGKLARFLSLLRWKRPNIRVLEIGGGSGWLTGYILSHLSPRSDASSIEQYLFTESDPDLIEKAKKHLGDWKDLITYQPLDLASDPAGANFQPGTFDLVITSNVPSNSNQLLGILKQAKALLKPQGRFLYLEHHHQNMLWQNIAFGLLPGLLPPERHADLSEDEWTSALHQAGFSGTDLFFSGAKNLKPTTLNALVSTSQPPPSTADGSKVIILTQSQDSGDIARLLKGQLDLAGVPCSFKQLKEIKDEDYSQAVFVSLLELATSILDAADENTFLQVRNFLTKTERLLWLTGDPAVHPAFNMATGLIRTVRWEHDHQKLNLVIMSIDDMAGSQSDAVVNSIHRVVDLQFLAADVSSSRNSEYRLQNTLIHTNRVVKNTDATTALTAKFGEPEPALTPWEKVDRPLKIDNSKPGAIDLHWVVDNDLQQFPLQPQEVEVDIQAVGINFRDLLAAMGELDQPTLGGEAAGVIRAIGDSVKNVRPGDRVALISDPSSRQRVGSLRTRGRVHHQLVVKLPEKLSFDLAAGMPIIHSTVIYSLGHLARLSAGERILIHAAAGGVGQAAIQYSQAIGAEIFVTVSSREKREFIMRQFRIPESHILYSRDLTFARGVKRMAPGGVDVVLNSLSGEALQQSWDCIAPFGRFVELGKRDMQSGSKLNMAPFLKNVTMASADLFTVARLRPALCQQLLQETMRLWEANKIAPVQPTKVLSYGKLGEALRLLQTGKNIGKIVVVPDSTAVSVVPSARIPCVLNPYATYVLAGGLGGIGRSIARRLAKRGARNIVFLSRSGRVTEAVEALTAQLEELGCASHIFRCDITDSSQVRNVLSHCSQTLAPVKGCINCSVAWRDGAFETMSPDSWHDSLAPKVKGSWNLHTQLSNVDFFLMLASISGIIGNRSQANYNAGNTFEDALAHHRVASGMPSASIDLGAVLDVGFMAENQDRVQHTLRVAGHHTEEEVMAIIDYLIDGCLQGKPHTEPTAQLISGLLGRADFQRRGVSLPRHLEDPLFAHLPAALSDTALSSGLSRQSGSIRDMLTTARSQQQGVEIVVSGVQQKLSNLLNVSEDGLDPSRDLRSNGVDSLIQMEFRSWLARELGTTIAMSDMTTKSLLQLSTKIVSGTNLPAAES